ncbi:MAG: ABC transporter ATP-binding protein [Pseudomonadota bacterium]|nr:ABC transporter ATP-binding protein [Pseudomonadota bacterium]
MLLEVRNLDVVYGRTHAVKEINLDVAANEIVAVLGSNGAGKSSLLKALHGMVPIQNGSIKFDGKELATLSSANRVERRLALVPEGRQILVSMTVHENLLIGGCKRRDKSLLSDIATIYERFPNLGERRESQASTLSGGEQQMLAIGRALVSQPRLIMLDEPSLGLSPILVEQLFELIRELNNDGIAILLVEQNTKKALEVSSRGYVMELGKTVLEGSAKALAKDSGLVHAYLGKAS